MTATTNMEHAPTDNPACVPQGCKDRPIAISVILCTYNRCESLARALHSVAASQLPESVRWEVLVIDNNSTDQTRGVTEEFCRKHPGCFRYIFEPRQGKSIALNTGIREAHGDIFAFIDDDVTVEPTWLRNLTAALGTSEWAGTGGRILPACKFVKPGWLMLEDRHALAPLALFDRGLLEGALTESPYGTNMAYRRAMFEKHGPFRTDLGPQGDSRVPQKSEDSEFGRRLLDAGEHLRYEPTAIVYHEIPDARVRKTYFLNWWFDKSRSDIRASGVPSDAKWLMAGISLELVCRCALWAARWMTTIEPARRFSAKTKVWAVAGWILESYRQSRDRTTELRRTQR
jgi:glycosyltransferase involved in cell wall biosynthesis